MPIDSLYEATKSSIEQGIFELQEKLRRKNQLDLENQLRDNLVRQQKFYRQQKDYLDMQKVYLDNAKYGNTLMQRTSCDPYVSSVLYDSGMNDLGGLGYLELKQTMRRQAEQLQHLKRLERIQQETMALENRAINGYRAQIFEDQLMKHSSPIQQFKSNHNSPSQSKGYGYDPYSYQPRRSPPHGQSMAMNLQYDNPLEQDSSALIQKYNKGIRAEQYNKDMERLIEIEKRLRKMQENPSVLSSAKRSYFPQGNESIVTPYEGRNEQLQKDRNLNTLHNKGIIRYQDNPGPKHEQRQSLMQQTNPQQRRYQEQQQNQQSPAQIHLNAKNRFMQNQSMFQNQRIGEVINKRKTEEQPQLSRHAVKEANRQKENNRHSALNKLDNYIKKTSNRNPIAKPLSINRPFTSKSRNATNRAEISRSTHSVGISPLKSDRHYQPYSNKSTKRQRAKSTNQRKAQNSSRTIRHNHEISLHNTGKQANSRLLSLDPVTEKIFEQILRKQINEKIQNRLQLLTCVFKDSKMRQEKNEMEALIHRFEIEARARKQVKCMINNDPKILKKHKMVIE